MFSGASIEQSGNQEGNEEQDFKKNQHQIEIQWRINLGDVWKEQRASQKKNGLLDEPFAKHEFRGGGGEAAGCALILGTRTTPLHTPSHALHYPVNFRSTPFPQPAFDP